MKKVFLLITLTASLTTAKAQDFEGLLNSGGDQASKLMTSYLQPVFEGTIYNLNNGWYRTAKTHKTLGFDITVNGSIAEVPLDKQTFLFDSNDYIGSDTNVTLASGEQTASLPTVLGDTTTEELIFSQTDGQLTQTINAPDGLLADTGYSGKSPLAMAQIGIGLPKKINLILRYTPKVEQKGISAQLYGIGLKHDILQYIPIAKNIPFLDISAFAGYTKLTASYAPTGDDYKDALINLDIQSYTAQILGSVDLKIISFYTGLGYTGGASSLNYSGQITARDDSSGTSSTKELSEIPSSNYDVSSFKATIGVSGNLSIFKIYADYSLQEYSSITAGIALSFR